MVGVPTRKTSDGAVATGNGSIQAVTLTAGSDAAKVVLYDNTSAAGAVLAELGAAAGESAVLTGVEIPFSTGIYADLTGTGPAVIVYT